MVEWDRFRKYTRRMRELYESGTLKVLSLEVFSVVQPRILIDLLPNLDTLQFSSIEGPFIPFISLFLSPRIASICLSFSVSNPFKTLVASTVAVLPTLCPNLQAISLFLPRDLMITAAVSEMVLATNQNTLQGFHADSPLTEEASEVVFKLPNLYNLSVVIAGETSLPSASLPNLTELEITYDDKSGLLRLFHGATFEKLETVEFFPQSEETGDFLGAFERVALSSSIENTLSKFYLTTSCSWNPNYSSILRFTQLVDLDIGFSCEDGCSSRVDDDTVISLSRAMPKLTVLQLGGYPCGELMTGVTAKGLVALAHHCPDLQRLCIHFQVASLSAPPASPGIGYNTEPTGSLTDCALTELLVGSIPVLEESVSVVAHTLLQIFPRIKWVDFEHQAWKKVEDAIRLSRRIAGCSSKHPLTTP